MKSLIVNADDFGLSSGVNAGIIQAYQHGIVTSTSVMIDGPTANEVGQLANFPNLSVGLHFQLTDESLIGLIRTRAKLYLGLQRNIEAEFNRQLEKFGSLVGRQPDHLDSHHHIHSHPQVKLLFKRYAQEHNIPVRDISARCIRSFFGRDWLWRKQPQSISVEGLKSILAQLPAGTNELMCHPAIGDMQLAKVSRYATERQTELQTVTNESIKEFIQEQRIKLMSWCQLN